MSATTGRPSEQDAVVARQALYDRSGSVAAYELLFRGTRGPDGRPLDDAQATAEVLLNTRIEVGWRSLVGEHPAWLNVSRAFLLTVGELPVDPDRVVLELLETDHDPGDAELLDALDRHRAAGFEIVLDDYVPQPGHDPLLERAVAVKLDVMAHGVAGVVAQARAVAGRGLRLVAEKIETREEHAALVDAGFDLFQGYFLEKPSVVRRKRLPQRAVGAIARTSKLLEAGEDFDRLERTVRDDPGHAVRILRLANSAFLGRGREVDTVRSALLTLGARGARQWLLVLGLADVGGSGDPLLTTALQRARLCELLAFGDPPKTRERCFSAGLLSVLDGILDTPWEDLLEQMPLGEELRAALLHREGRVGELLEQAIAIQRGDPPADAQAAGTEPELGRIAEDALAWTADASGTARAASEPDD